MMESVRATPCRRGPESDQCGAGIAPAKVSARRAMWCLLAALPLTYMLRGYHSLSEVGTLNAPRWW